MKRNAVIEVKLERFAEDDDPEDTGWFAEWGIRDDSAGTEDSAESLHDLVASITQDISRWTDRYDVTIEWSISGDTPEGSTVENEIRRLGVTLPSRITVS